MHRFRFFINEFDSTLEYHTILNPLLWKNEKLRRAIRKKLLNFGKVYAQYNNVPGNIIEDIIMVGGAAGYNYTKFSDIDVHVLIDKKKMGEQKLVDEIFKDKKKLWGLEHDIKVIGFPLEGYIQDISEEPPKSQGVYSLVRNEWIQKPALPPKLDPKDLGYAAKVTAWIDRINHLIDNDAPISQFKKMKKRLSQLRSSALEKGGEFAEGNRVFKELRNAGIFDKMNKLLIKKHDKALSLED